jgi:hypothetical protein
MSYGEKGERFAWLPGIVRLKRESKAFDPRQLASGSLASDTEMARTALTLASAASKLALEHSTWNVAYQSGVCFAAQSLAPSHPY